jgi:hypothetical protein
MGNLIERRALIGDVSMTGPDAPPALGNTPKRDHGLKRDEFITKRLGRCYQFP